MAGVLCKRERYTHTPHTQYTHLVHEATVRRRQTQQLARRPQESAMLPRMVPKTMVEVKPTTKRDEIWDLLNNSPVVGSIFPA